MSVAAATISKPPAGGERLTLELELASVWEGLLAAGWAPCPVCRAEMHRDGAGRGRCAGCGAALE